MSRRVGLAIAVGSLLLRAATPQPVRAQAISAQAAGTQQAGAGAPTSLVFPAVFDRAAVQSLLEHIDEERNDLVLWAGYFVPNGSRELPGAEGRRLLRGALDAERAGSLRWFKLQYLNTYVSLRYDSPRAGLAAYGAVFQAASALQSAGEPSARQSQIIARLVDQYVNFLPAPWMAGAKPEQVEAVLVAAFQCWTALPSQDVPAEKVLAPKALHQINWGAAAATCGGQGLRAEAERQLKLHTAGSPERDAYLLLACADILRLSQPERAQHLAEEARPLLPPEESGPVARNSWARCRALLVDSLSRQKKWPESEAVQREAIAARGSGYARLIRLMHEGGRDSELEAVVQTMETSSVEEDDLLRTADLLREWAAGKPSSVAPALAERLYRAELAPRAGRTPAERTPAGQLAARVSLARSLFKGARREGGAANAQFEEAGELLAPEPAQAAGWAPERPDLVEEYQSLRQEFAAWKTTRKLVDGVATPAGQPKTTPPPAANNSVLPAPANLTPQNRT